MARVLSRADLSDRWLAEAAQWYADNDAPKAFRLLDPLLVAYVREQGIDWRRCTTDGTSILIANHPVWSPS